MEDRPYAVEPFRPSDAALVPRLFLEVYGDTYPVRMVYHPEEMIAAFEAGHYFPFVIRAASDRLAAYGALYQSAPYKGIYEFGQGAVSSEFRCAGLGRLLFEHVARYAPTLPGSEMYFGEAVCNHTHTQKAGALIETIETGIEMDLLPGDVYSKFREIEGRVAVVDMFRTYVARPHAIHVPAVYGDILRYVCEGFDDTRRIEISSGEAPSNSATVFSTRVFPAAGVVRIAVQTAGADFEASFDTLMDTMGDDGLIRVMQVWLNLSCPWTGRIADALRRRGFFFGGLFPRWFDDDGLLLQKVLDRPGWSNVQLYSTRSRDIFDFIRSDWEIVQKHTEG
jgi:hypothetical protein